MSPAPAANITGDACCDCGQRLSATSDQAESVPGWAALIIVVTALLSGAGGVLAVLHPTLLTPPHSPMNAAARVFAGYTLSRDLAVAAALLGLLVLRARRALYGMLLLVALIQVIDIAVDATTDRLALLPGLGALVLLVLSAAWQLTQPPRPVRPAPRPSRRTSAN